MPEEMPEPSPQRDITSASADQLLRQTRAHHVQLSAMADIKANILLTVSTLITTYAAGYLDSTAYFWPVIILMGLCIPTIICAIYAVMPKVSLGRHHKNIDPSAPTFNLLFFGNFCDLDYETYKRTMQEAVADPEQAYELMIREIYTLGDYLMRKKYRYLRLAYLFFLTGIVCSGVAFAIQVFVDLDLDWSV